MSEFKTNFPAFLKKGESDWLLEKTHKTHKLEKTRSKLEKTHSNLKKTHSKLEKLTARICCEMTEDHLGCIGLFRGRYSAFFQIHVKPQNKIEGIQHFLLTTINITSEFLFTDFNDF